MRSPPTVTLCPGPGETLLDAALRCGVALMHECGGNCACTTCAVLVVAGAEHLSDMDDPERARLELEERLADGVRLACQAVVAASDAGTCNVTVRPILCADSASSDIFTV